VEIYPVVRDESLPKPIQRAYRVKVKAEVEVVKKDLGDALMEAGKKIVGAGTLTIGLGCIRKAVEERNPWWAVLAIPLVISGVRLII